MVTCCRPSTASCRDFITDNILCSTSAAAAKAAAQAQKAQAKAAEEGKFLHKDTYGKVPQYLRNIKLELARQHADKQVWSL